ncbi:C6 finger domain protein [Zalerion maritima]|uniref:C6 finger domain protein n=1 Tax=Zalerion maritima TaxID=339359 RepID=A0AAD5RYT5_9PEZI|nr:C6 finger domain protein [Zalerion maritima]
MDAMECASYQSLHGIYAHRKGRRAGRGTEPVPEDYLSIDLFRKRLQYCHGQHKTHDSKGRCENDVFPDNERILRPIEARLKRRKHRGGAGAALLTNTLRPTTADTRIRQVPTPFLNVKPCSPTQPTLSFLALPRRHAFNVLPPSPIISGSWQSSCQAWLSKYHSFSTSNLSPNIIKATRSGWRSVFSKGLPGFTRLLGFSQAGPELGAIWSHRLGFASSLDGGASSFPQYGCDETRPHCSNCITVRRKCEYKDTRLDVSPGSASASALASALASASAALPPYDFSGFASSPAPSPNHHTASSILPEDEDINMLHLELLHEHKRYMFRFFGNNPEANETYSDLIIRTALKAPFLMYEILAFGAQTISVRCQRDRERELEKAMEREKGDYPPTASTSNSTPTHRTHGPASFPPPQGRSTPSEENSSVTNMNHRRGGHQPPKTAEFYHLVAVKLQTKALSTLNSLEQADMEPDENRIALFLFASVIGLQKLIETLQFLPPGGGTAEQQLDAIVEKFVHYFRLRLGVRAVASGHWATLLHSELQPLIHIGGAKAKSKGKGHECDPLMALFISPERHLRKTGLPPLSDRETKECIRAVELLQWTVDCFKEGKDDDAAWMTLSWIPVVGPEVATVMEQKRPEALVMMAYYAALTHLNREICMLGDPSACWIVNISAVLGDRWETCLKWPKSVVEDKEPDVSAEPMSTSI